MTSALLILGSSFCLLSLTSATGCPRRGKDIAPRRLTSKDGMRALDSFHSELLRERILSGLGLAAGDVPEGQPDSARRTRQAPPPARPPPPSYTVRAGPSISGSCEGPSNCSLTASFEGRLGARGDVRRPSLRSAVLSLPHGLWTAARLHLRLRPHGPWRSLHDDFPFNATPSATLVPLASNLTLDHERRFHVQLRVETVEGAGEAELGGVWLEMEAEEGAGRGRRWVGSEAAAEEEAEDRVGDCEAMWDARALNETAGEVADGVLPCCRRRLRVNFAELGWGHFVLAPAVFHTHYCLGRCREFGGFGGSGGGSEEGLGSGAEFYAALMRRKAASLGLSACCAPVAFAPLTLTVALSPDRTLTKTLNDVRVQACGCI